MVILCVNGDPTLKIQFIPKARGSCDRKLRLVHIIASKILKALNVKHFMPNRAAVIYIINIGQNVKHIN